MLDVVLRRNTGRGLGRRQGEAEGHVFEEEEGALTFFCLTGAESGPAEPGEEKSQAFSGRTHTHTLTPTHACKQDNKH